MAAQWLGLGYTESVAYSQWVGAKRSYYPMQGDVIKCARMQRVRFYDGVLEEIYLRNGEPFPYFAGQPCSFGSLQPEKAPPSTNLFGGRRFLSQNLAILLILRYSKG